MSEKTNPASCNQPSPAWVAGVKQMLDEIGDGPPRDSVVDIATGDRDWKAEAAFWRQYSMRWEEKYRRREKIEQDQQSRAIARERRLRLSYESQLSEMASLNEQELEKRERAAARLRKRNNDLGKQNKSLLLKLASVDTRPPERIERQRIDSTEVEAIYL